MKRIDVLSLAAAVLLLTSCDNHRSVMEASGVFEATEIIISAESAGRILRLSIDEGHRLSAGQPIGAIDSIQQFFRRQQLLATIGATQSRRPDINTQIAALKQQIATAQSEKRRIENLLGANAATAKQLDDANAQIAVLEKQLAAQNSALSLTNQGVSSEIGALELQVAQADDLLAKCRIVNPVEGVVLTRYAHEGEYAAPGKALYKIADIDTINLRAYITSDQLTKLKLGQQVSVSADFGEKGNRPYKGIISWISDKAEFTPKTIQTRNERANLVYAVKVRVVNDGYLKIGMYGGIALETK